MTLRANKILWNRSKFLYNKETDIEDFGKVQYMRYIVSFGAPIDVTSKKSLDDPSKPGERYSDLTDRKQEQKLYIDRF